MKRFLSLILAVVMLVSTASGIVVNVSAATQVEQIIAHAKYIADNKPHAYDGYCLAFCGACYQAAGYPAYSMGDAYKAGTAWIQSTSSTNIPVGALVFYDYTWNAKYGHVGIYAGNGKMYDVESAYGGVKLRNFKTNGYRGWGWYGGIAPSGSSGGGSSTPSPSYNYQAITPGSYYIRSNGQSEHNYLTVSYTSADSGASVNAWSFLTVSRVQIAKNGGNFYTMQFPDISTANAVNVHTNSTYPTSTTKVTNYKYSGSTTQSWGFDKVSGGYVIRCKANPNMVLTCNGSGQATVSVYSAGNSNQIWSLVPYISGTVTYNANGGSGAPSSQTKYFNQILTLSNVCPTKSGYTFKGWGTSSSDTSPNYYAGSNYNSESGITLYAIWERNQNTTYTIKYDANGGSGAPSSQTKVHGKTLVLSSNVPTRFGYTFLGWGLSPEATSGYYPGGNFSKNANTTLYANWREASQLSASLGVETGSFEIKFNNCHKYFKITPKYNRKYRFESTGSLDTKIYIYDASGNICASNNDSGEGTNFKLDYTLTAGKTYYIKMVCKTKGTYNYKITAMYNVTYDANGGTGAPNPQTKFSKTDLILSTEKPSREGYTFLGWAKKSDATTVDFAPGSTYTLVGNVTLYAVWKANSYKISFDANGGTCGTAQKAVVFDSTYGTLPVPVRNGYTFAGWYNSLSGGSKISESTKYTTAGNTVLYAHWTQRHTHTYIETVTKEATCTEDGELLYRCSCGDSYTESIAATGHTPSGELDGWYASSDNSGYLYRYCEVCYTVLEEYYYDQCTCWCPSLYNIVNSAKGVVIDWEDVYGADSYVVYRKTYSTKNKAWSGWSRIAEDVTSTSYTDKTVKSGTYYRYTVRAENEAGLSDFDTSGLKTYFLSTPTVKTSNSKSGVSVKWNKVAGAKGYYVYRKTTGGWTRIATIKGNGTVSYTDKSAKSGTTYKYTVKAYYGSYTSSNKTSAAVRRLVAPTLKSVSSAKSGVTVKWGKVTGATGYIVYRKTGNGDWSRLKVVEGNSKVSYLDKTTKKGVTYKYTVRAYYGTSKSNYDTKGLTIKDKY